MAGAHDVPRPQYNDPLQLFHELMPRRVRRMLLVGSRYDFFLLWEDGQLSQHLLSEWVHIHLTNTSWITVVSTAEDALAACRGGRIDLVVVTPHVRDMKPAPLGRLLLDENPDLTVVPLAFDDTELTALLADPDVGRLQRPFLWQGDFRLLLGIVQSLEDRWNVGPDTQSIGVSVVILIEDGVHYYSSFLPMVYHQLHQQSQRVIAEGTSLHHKIMRLRARPKILHCVTFEEARDHLERFRPYVLGVIADVNFPREGRDDPQAGIEFARLARRGSPGIPIMLQTNEPGLLSMAESLQAAIVLKRSPRLLEDVGRFMRESFGFGPFIFQDDRGASIGQAADLRELEQQVAAAPADAIIRHAARNHFSTWLRARTEFRLAEALRATNASDFDSHEDVREFLVDSIRQFREGRQAGAVTEFDPTEFNPRMSFARLGGGSLGGKARGLAFVRSLIHRYDVRRPFPKVRIFVPAGLVLATEVFDRFLDDNGLLDFAVHEQDDRKVEERFLAAQMPKDVLDALRRFLEFVHYPLAVRSSSLLEDSQDFSLTGAYETYMVANHHADVDVRLRQTVLAIKRVYASMFATPVKQTFYASPYRLEEEKMAVILQRLVGSTHDGRCYPDLSGVARSHNFYPIEPMKAEDGIARIALGLGETVVRGEKAVSFCPRHPDRPIHFSTTKEILATSQRAFYALDLDEASSDDATPILKQYGLQVAIADGKMRLAGSVFSPENDVVYDGVGRPGVPLVTFAPTLKQHAIPLAEILCVLLDVGQRALNMPVEIEFAVNVPETVDEPLEFALLQIRPFALHDGRAPVDLDSVSNRPTLCRSRLVLGHGVIDDIRDIVVVDRDRFDRARSVETAKRIGEINSRLTRDGTPFVLIGVGRWGSADPWLGIPVTWPQINGARVIVESDFKDVPSTPSQGSHFFQNITSSGVGYFTVGGADDVGDVDWNWLANTPAIEDLGLVRHVRLERPLTVMMDGQRGHGVILTALPGVERT